MNDDSHDDARPRALRRRSQTTPLVAGGLAIGVFTAALPGCDAGSGSARDGAGGQDGVQVGRAREALSATTPALNQCVTIERGQQGAVADAAIVSSAPTKNFGASATASAGSIPGATRQILMRFDVSQVPPGATVTNANVDLARFGTPTGPATLQVHRVTAPWTEGTVTWQSFGGAFDAGLVATFSDATATPMFNLPALAQSWVAAPALNYGILIETPAALNATYYTSEYGSQYSQPVLHLCYDTCAAPGPCHSAGVWVSLGVCTSPPQPDGTACDDGNPATPIDTCQAGVCVGAAPTSASSSSSASGGPGSTSSSLSSTASAASSSVASATSGAGGAPGGTVASATSGAGGAPGASSSVGSTSSGLCGVPPPSSASSSSSGAGGGAPASGHPRLWLTAADLPRLQAWATPCNPLWTQGMVPLITAAEATYEGNTLDGQGHYTSFFPAALNGQPNPSWPDVGGSSVGAPYVETYAEFYAFLSLVTADPGQSQVYAQRARALLMHAINAAASCPAAPAVPPPGYQPPPYCDPGFAVYNRANYDGEAWGLTVDWIYSSLTPADKATLHTVFLGWADAVNHTGGAPPAGTTGPALLTKQYANNTRQFRSAANNYYSGNMRNRLLLALSFDAADDPGLALGSYVDQYATVELYQQFAMYESASTVAAAYKLGAADLASSDVLGLASGGLPTEGFLYGHSLGYVFEGLYALHTAGRDDLVKYGPQAGLIDGASWSQFVDGFLASLAPVPLTPKAPFAYMPQVTQMASYGDLLYDYVTEFDFLATFSLLAVHDAAANPARQQKDLWLARNALPGGAPHLYASVANAWNNSLSSAAILAFMAFDPAAAPPADPRPALPTTFYSPGNARLLARTDWSAGASLFDHLCGWASIDHQDGTCGQFELFRKGEWLTKERSGYDNGVYPGPIWGYAPDYHNVLGIQNDFTQVVYTTLRGDQKAAYQRGGQWNEGANAGDPSSVASFGAGYAYARDDATNLYNYVPSKYDPTSGSATDVAHASRSILWLEPDRIVVYDRAVSKTAGHFKRWNLVLDQGTDANRNPVPPAMSPLQLPSTGGPATPGTLIQETTPNGQVLYVQAVLPATQAVALNLVEPFYPVAWLEPTQAGPIVAGAAGESGYHLQIDDASVPLSSRFLNVLQGADAGVAPDALTLVTSTGGVALDGVAIQPAGVAGPSVVLFVRDPASLGAVASTTFPALPGASTYMLDLTPATVYRVLVAGGSVTVSSAANAPGVAVTSDAAGVLTF